MSQNVTHSWDSKTQNLISNKQSSDLEQTHLQSWMWILAELELTPHCHITQCSKHVKQKQLLWNFRAKILDTLRCGSIFFREFVQMFASAKTHWYQTQVLTTQTHSPYIIFDILIHSKFIALLHKSNIKIQKKELWEKLWIWACRNRLSKGGTLSKGGHVIVWGDGINNNNNNNNLASVSILPLVPAHELDWPPLHPISSLWHKGPMVHKKTHSVSRQCVELVTCTLMQMSQHTHTYTHTHTHSHFHTHTWTHGYYLLTCSHLHSHAFLHMQSHTHVKCRLTCFYLRHCTHASHLLMH